MDELKSYFKNYQANPTKLIAYGFKKQASVFKYEIKIINDTFKLVVVVNNGTVVTEVLDLMTNEPYTLHLLSGPRGDFIASVREAYFKVLDDIKTHCFDYRVFMAKQSQLLIDYVSSKYHNELEFLWPKTPYNAIWRRDDNHKWYGVMMRITSSKLKIANDDEIEVINLRLEADKMADLIDHEKYFPGWHMNKQSWYTIILDGRVSITELYARIDESYRLALNKRLSG